MQRSNALQSLVRPKSMTRMSPARPGSLRRRFSDLRSLCITCAAPPPQPTPALALPQVHEYASLHQATC